ncbi:MAG: PQQ-binding-like beta-propeller repeat protein [Vicinamibacterales bacterium]
MPLGLVVALAAASAACAAGDVDWPHYARDLHSTKYSPAAQIAPANVGQLAVAWRHPALPASLTSAHPSLRVSNNYRATPIMAGGRLFVPNAVGLVEALNPATGDTLWIQAPKDDGFQGVLGTSSRGVGYWRDTERERIFVVRGDYLLSLDAATGRPVETFGEAGAVDLRVGMGEGLRSFRWTSAPLVVRDVVVVGSPGSDFPSQKEMVPGDVRGYDARTGALKWTFHVIPRAGEPGIETWDDDAWKYTGAANLWALMSADPELGLVYLPLTSPTNDWYGGQRPGNGLFGDTLVCLDVETGRRVWHYQITHHDLWDYDLPAAPILADVVVDGQAIKAVVQLTKQGFAFVFDRVSGRPVWPIEERPVPPSSVPGEIAATTQPFPAKPPAFERQGIGEDDLIDFTPELRAEALRIANDYVLGPMFTPPPVAGANGKKAGLMVPSWVGGANWNGGGFDPDTGMLYVPSVTAATVMAVAPGDPADTDLRYLNKLSRPQREIAGPRGLPLLKPPYGRITAIDLSRGEIAWMVPNGDGPRHHPELKDLKLPRLGQPGRAAPLVTKTLLFVGEGDPINLATPPWGGGTKFRAYDKTTGAVLWETDLPAGTTGAPMSYVHRGKQYIVVAIGSQSHASELMAFALP